MKVLVLGSGPTGNELVRPWVGDHIAIDGDAADPRIYEYAGPYFAMTALPSSLQPAEPLARAVYETGWRAPYAPGPSRDQLVEVIDDAVLRGGMD